MTFFSSARVAVVAAAVVCSLAAFAQDESVEEELHVHRLGSEMTAPYDGFIYANRVPGEPAEGESPAELAGRALYSRLPNVEGRIQLKVLDGFDRAAYLGYKTFMRAWPEPGNAVGNCVVCHTPPSFGNGTTPSLRNLNKSDEELAAAVRSKIEMAVAARDGNAEIDEAYTLVELGDEDVTNLVSFLQSLNEVPKERFRELITNAEILDTSDMLR